MPELRPFAWEDLDGAVSVQNASARPAAGEAPASAEALAAAWRRGGAQAERDLWVVQEGGAIVAYGALRLWSSAEWLQAEIVVHPSWRRRGVGQALLGRLVDEAQKRGVLYLGAVAADEPPAAGRWLRGRGFEVSVARLHMRLQPIVVPGAAPVPGHRLRLADVGESAVLVEVSNAAYRGTLWPAPADEAGYRRYLEESGVRVWVAERLRGRRTVGLCEVGGRETAIDGAMVTSGHISSLAVRPESRGRGLGRWLLAAATRLCQEAGWPAVDLNVDRDNQPARRLYESAGFRAVYGYTVYRLPLA